MRHQQLRRPTTAPTPAPAPTPTTALAATALALGLVLTGCSNADDGTATVSSGDADGGSGGSSADGGSGEGSGGGSGGGSGDSGSLSGDTGSGTESDLSGDTGSGGGGGTGSEGGGEGAIDTGVYSQLPDLVERVEPSVVTIATGTGLGSGVVYRTEGVIITNEHVVRGATDVEVSFADGTTSPGRVLAADADYDLAVVQSEREGLPAADFADELPRVGSFVVAIGSPLGFENSVSAGIVSGLGREVPGAAEAGSRALVDLIQTDAAISPGNSGGALVDAAGAVVGINDAYIPPQAGAVSIGFAIPAATAVDVAEDLLEDGRVTSAFIGITPGRLTPDIVDRFQLGVDEGVLVQEVTPGSPAQEAGLRPGDVITSLAGETVESVEAFLGALRGVEPGDRVQLEVSRGGGTTAVEVTAAGRTS